MNELLKFIRSKEVQILFMDLVALVSDGENLHALIGIKECSLDNLSQPTWSSINILVDNNFNPQSFIDVCKVSKIKCSVFAGLSIERYVLE